MRSRSRVLFVDHAAALGGGELSLVDVARAYRETSTFVLFADGPFRERLVREGVQVQVIEGGPALHSVRRETVWPSVKAASGALSLAFRLAGLARRHDCLHANSQKAFVVACLAGALARRPVIWDLNDLLIPAHFSRTNIRLDVALANHLACRVIANSKAAADALIAQGGRPDKVRVVHNGIASAPFDAVTDDEVADARRELGLDGAPVIGVFGRLGEWKGQDIALDALRQLPSVRMLLVGDALFGEQPYVERLRTQVDRHGLGDRVRFLGFRSDIPRLMRLVHVVPAHLDRAGAVRPRHRRGHARAGVRWSRRARAASRRFWRTASPACSFLPALPRRSHRQSASCWRTRRGRARLRRPERPAPSSDSASTRWCTA